MDMANQFCHCSSETILWVNTSVLIYFIEVFNVPSTSIPKDYGRTVLVDFNAVFELILCSGRHFEI